MNDQRSGKELFIQNTTCAFRKLLSAYVFSYFPFGFEGRIWNLIVSVPGHCLAFYLAFYHYQELYNIMLPGSSGIMSPAEHDLVLYNIMMIWFYLYNMSC